MSSYGADHADVYDAVYRGRGKDYAAEADDVLRLLRERRPDIGSLLDVACGTGAHLDALRKSVDHVEGVELAPAMHALAVERLPGVAVHHDDMRTFDLGRTFDAITCMFSSVGYLTSTEELDRTLAVFRRHLTPGGVVLVEPWWFPEEFLDGYIGSAVVEVDGRTIARVSHTVREGDSTRMTVEYTVGEPATGLRRFSDTHVLSLFTREQYERAFERAGLAVEYVVGGPSGRGLFLATAPATAAAAVSGEEAREAR
ncbi:class I SAM-dependent DNA methyltransferase [Streptomyces sp. NPDC057644]|uniref:class I SAM-dependent DNA methyltransferase n=1 Tax=Streptomyces sp. NPDC057644 TaxID=3346191 RepID=UPI0036A1780B